MRRYLLAAAAAVAMASPAAARDNSWYAGIEGGLLLVEDNGLDYEDDEDEIDDAVLIDHKMGIDVDVIGGYDFGAFRAEGELGYKRASVDEVAVGPLLGGPPGEYYDANGKLSMISAMANLLLDFGDDNGLSGYVGPGVGIVRAKSSVGSSDLDAGFRGTDSALAWQAIGGVRMAVSPNLDLGLKYRYFNTGRLKYGGDEGINSDPFELNTRVRSHSLLASLIYNFLPPPPPPVVIAPPPPPMAPATQTCPDGTVILATEVCPLPPPPPPPPPAGERG